MVTVNVARIERVRRLRDHVQTVISEVRELERELSLLARADRERWEAVLDALSASMEAGEPGSLAHVVAALAAALEDDRG